MTAVPVPDPVVEETARADPTGRRPAVTGQPAERLHIPHPLSVPAADPVRRRAAGAAGAAPGPLVSCHWAEEIRDGVLHPKSAEEVAATMGVSVRPTGAGPIETDALVQGVDQPIERT